MSDRRCEEEREARIRRRDNRQDRGERGERTDRSDSRCEEERDAFQKRAQALVGTGEEDREVRTRRRDNSGDRLERSDRTERGQRRAASPPRRLPSPSHSRSPPPRRRRCDSLSRSRSAPRVRRRRVSRSRSWSEYQRRRGASRERKQVEDREERAEAARERQERAEKEREERAQKEPSETVLVHGIPEQGLAEDQLESMAWDLAVKAGSSMPNGVRFAYDRETQQFRGFATLEFPHKDAARAFKDYTKGVLEVEGFLLTLKYHHSFVPERERSPSRGDRRGSPRDEPSEKIIVKGLSSSTQEVAIAATFQALGSIKDIRHFPRRGFAFVQFHSIEEATQALRKFEDECRNLIDGVRCVAHFAKGKEDGRFMAMEGGFLAKQALASAEATAQIEKMERQQVQNKNTEKALSGVNGGMWASYMQSCSQTETVQSAETFIYDKASGFHLDSKAGLYYDPQTTFFFTTDFQKHFMYDQDAEMLCLVDGLGQKVKGGEKRPLSSKDRPNIRPRDDRSAVSSRRSRSRGLPARGGSRSRSRRRVQRSRSRRRLQRSRSPEAPHRGIQVKLNQSQRHPCEGFVKFEGPQDARPIHFPGGDPLARLAAPEPVPAPKPEVKKKRRPPGEQILGLASTPIAAIARPGRVTVLSSAPRPGPVQIASQPQLTVTLASPMAVASTVKAASAPRRWDDKAQAQQPVAGPGEWICEVCMRKFSSEQMLRKHENFSDLHKQNLAKLNGDV